ESPPSREAIEKARAAWREQSARDQQDLIQRRQWLEALEKTQPNLAAHLAASARVIAAPLAAVPAEAAGFRPLVADEAARPLPPPRPRLGAERHPPVRPVAGPEARLAGRPGGAAAAVRPPVAEFARRPAPAGVSLEREQRPARRSPPCLLAGRGALAATRGRV